MTDELSLAQDVCARICHDLGGPLGALSGALDLAEAAPDEALSVARDGAEAMRRRLRLWRAAAGAGIGPLGRDGLAELLDGSLSNGRVMIDLSGLDASVMPAPLAQALLAAAMVGSEALPRGGLVRVAGCDSEVTITPEGRNANWPHALTAVLAGETVTGPRDVVAPLLLSLSEAAGIVLSLATGPGEGVAPLVLRPAPGGRAVAAED
ncbi:histidine phosphotransferase family protein [Roseomonas sp. WA12]